MNIAHYFNSNDKWIALLGGAGAGKTVTAKETKDAMPLVHYSADYRFIGDSAFRKELLHVKSKQTWESYRDSMNQSSWWNWNDIVLDLCLLADGIDHVTFVGYDRDTGTTTKSELVNHPNLLYEGVMLPEMLWSLFDKIIYLHTPDEVRFQRLIDKDKDRRSPTELAARYLICDYSEKMFYENLFDKLDMTRKLLYLDETGHPIGRPTLSGIRYLPVEV